MKRKIKQKSELSSLMNVGAKTLADLKCLGIKKIAHLQNENPKELYQRLQYITGEKYDICVIDVFAAIIHEANTGEKLPWWHWSRLRKSGSLKNHE